MSQPTCIVCTKPLAGLRTVYCDDTCYNRAKNRKRRGQPIPDSAHFSTDTCHYVYGWLDGDEVFYIGRSATDRNIEHPRYRRLTKRNPLAMMRRVTAELKGTFAAGYFAQGLTGQQAFELEAKLIASIRPQCNEQHNDTPYASQPSQRGWKVEGGRIQQK